MRRCPTCTIVAGLRSARRPHKKIRDQLNRILRRRKPNALRRRTHPGQHRSRRQPILAAHQRVQPLQRQRQVRSALVIGERVNLIDDHRATRARRFFRGFPAVSRMYSDSGVVTRMCGGCFSIAARSFASVSPVRTPVRISGQR